MTADEYLKFNIQSADFEQRGHGVMVAAFGWTRSGSQASGRRS